MVIVVSGSGKSRSKNDIYIICGQHVGNVHNQ